MRQFITLRNGDQLCPKCGSLPRTRRLWDLIENEIEDKSILHFSPSLVLKNRIEAVKTKRYVSTDYENEFLADQSYNIENLPEADETFDLIICYHVLEHIENDTQAMSELYRVLKTGGQCYVQTPFRDGDILENASVVTKKDRLKFFGQEDHVRVYSVNGLKRRLEQVGFESCIIALEKPSMDNHGFKAVDYIIHCKK